MWPCVYGTLKPVNTWNPLLINFQHISFLIQDAWHTNNIGDKLKIWFMPTGWRPQDIIDKYPRNSVENVYSQKKYKPNYTLLHKIFVGFHFITLNIVLFIFLNSFADLTIFDKSGYLILIFSTIFSFSSIMDGFKWSVSFEFVRIIIGVIVILLQGDFQLSSNPSMSIFLLSYLIISFILNLLVQKSVPERILQEIS